MQRFQREAPQSPPSSARTKEHDTSNNMDTPFDEEELQLLYSWVDEIPLSRPKKNIARDFSDGVMMAEVVKHFFPKLVDLHNYSSTSSSKQKIYNWNTLDRKFYYPLIRI